MICPACSEQRHQDCPAHDKGRSWCDCQHQTADRDIEPATGHASE